jgi:hypothetical protein
LLLSLFLSQKFLATLSETPSSLRALIEALPAKRDNLLDHMRDLSQRFVDKGLLEFSYVHHLLWEYTSECNTNMTTTRLTDLVNLLSDSALKLITTKPGSRTMCVIISNSSAKDRKKIMKSLKGHVLESLLHDSGHLAIMRLIDVTDDTVNVQKMLLDEIMILKPILKYSATGEQINDPFPPLIKIAKHPFGRKFLLRLLSPNKRHLEPDEEILFTTESIASGTSKKNPSVRRHEHVVYLRTPLLKIVSSYLHYLVTCQVGSLVLLEVISTFFSRQLLNQLVEMFSGRYEVLDTAVTVSTEEEEEEEQGEEGDEEEEEEEEEGGEDDGEGHGEENEGEEEEEEEYGQDDLEEALKADGEVFGDEEDDRTTKPKKTTTYPLPDLTSLEENPVAQLLLKRILDLQSTAEAQAADGDDSSSPDVIDDSLWERVQFEDDSEGFCRFALDLITALFLSDPSTGDDRLTQWIGKNRPSFILSDLLKVPSAREVLLKKLKSHKKTIKTNSKTSAGAKLLLAQMEKK